MNVEILLQNPRFHEFLRSVEAELALLRPEAPHREDALFMEKNELESQCEGWLLSLGNPSLSTTVRTAIHSQYEQAQARIQEIDAAIAKGRFEREQRSHAVDPRQVAEGLQQLSEILAGQNASAANLMLSQHIDAILCNGDGQVVVRTCKLGALAGAIEMIGPPPTAPGKEEEAVDGEVYRATPRRRGRLNVGAAISDDEQAAAANDFAVDPHRFAGLGPEWFTEDVFQVPRRLSWAEENARDVAEYRLQRGDSMEETAEHFGKTVPTIREALQYAKDLHGLDAFGKHVSQATRRYWYRENAAAVAEFFQKPGARMKDAVAHFGKSEPTIKKALTFARESAGQQSEGERTTPSGGGNS